MLLPRLIPFLLLLVGSLAAQGDAQSFKIVTEQGRHLEGHPQITADGQTLYFTRSRHPRNQGASDMADIWLRQKQADGSWGRALNAGGPINTFSDDQLIGISADGRRLAILRHDPNLRYSLDILAKGERSWRVVRSEPLADIPAEGLTATFELATNELIYSRLENGQYDLFRRHLLGQYGWSPEEKLGLLNSAEDERFPYRSPDGQSLYFRRSGNWQLGYWLAQRATFGADQPLGRSIPSEYLHMTITATSSVQLFATVAPVEDHSQLLYQDLPISAQPQPSKILRGIISGQAAQSTARELAIDVVVDQRTLTIYPDHNGRYAVVVPANLTNLELATPGYFLSSGAQANANPSDATNNSTNPSEFSEAYYQREQQIQQLHHQIASTTSEVAKLRAKRKALEEKVRKEQLAAGQEVLAGYIDPELAKLRSQVVSAQSNLRDTVPPSKPLVDKPTIRREDNAATIDELTALRNRFKAAKQALGEEDWTANDPVTLRKSAARQLNEEVIPTISQEIARSVYAEQQIDSLAMEQNIRSSLFATNQPAVYEREPWENELIENIDPSTKQALRERLQEPIQNSALADRALQQELYAREIHLQQLKDSLDQQLTAQLQEESALTSNPMAYTAPTVEQSGSPAGGSMTTKGGIPLPYANNSNAVVIPFAAGQTITLKQLRFGPNSAIIKPGTEMELNRLINQLSANPQLRIEIGVHENGSQSYLAASQLSEQRAARIAAFLISQGAAADQIVAVGYGRQQPIANDSTPEGRLRNQRVEIRVF